MSKKTCLFVEGIPTEVDNTTVIKIMKQYGSCYVNIKDDWAYAFVDYDDDCNASDAFMSLNGSFLGGKKISVRWWRRAPSNDLCKQYLKGKCRYGKDCRYVHEKKSENLKKPKTLPKEAKTLSDECTKLSEEPKTKNNDLDSWFSAGVDKEFVSTLKVVKEPVRHTQTQQKIPVEHESDMNMELSKNMEKLYSHL